MPAWNETLLNRIGAMGIEKRLPVAAAVLMTLLVAQSLAVMTWNLLPQPQVEESVAVVVSTGAVSDKGQKYKSQIAQISRWHLFGEVQQAPAPAVETVTDAPDTRLNLKLLGVMASTEPDAARAIIADSRGVEDTYAVGKQLPGNAVLRAIYPDRVILESRGRLETLRLPKESVSIGFESDDKKGRVISSRPALQTPRSAPSINTKTVRNSQTSALLRQYREALINNPQSIMNLVSAAPVTEAGTGKLKGYRIRPGKDKALLTKFGLEDGDVVTAVNGVPLDNPIKALEIMRDLSTASSVSLDLERKGIRQSLSFQVD